MIEVLTIPIPKESLANMPLEERALFLRFGYVSNQLSLLQKLLNFSTNDQPTDDLRGVCAGAQMQILLRLFVGAVAESWKLVEERIVKSSLRNAEVETFDEGGKSALNTLERLFRDSKLLIAVRSTYGFHLVKSDKEVDKAFTALLSNTDVDGLWNLYASHHGFNSFFMASDLIFVQGVAKLSGEVSLDAAQERLLREVSSASINLIEFSRAWMAAAWKRHFGDEMRATKATQITDAPHIDDVRLPFFVEVSEPPYLSPTPPSRSATS